MIEINLLTTGDKRRSQAAPAARRAARGGPAFAADPAMAGLGVAAALVILGTAFAWWRIESRKTEVNAQIEQAVADSTRYATTIQLMESLRARQDTIRQRIEVIRGVDENRYVWPHLLDEISRAVPQHTWLTSVSSTEGAEGDSIAPEFTVEGNAGSTQALTRLMKNLESSPFVRGVTLVTSAQAVEGGRAFQRFTLEASYERPDSSVIRTVPVVTE